MTTYSIATDTTPIRCDYCADTISRSLTMRVIDYRICVYCLESLAFQIRLRTTEEPDAARPATNERAQRTLAIGQQ